LRKVLLFAVLVVIVSGWIFIGKHSGKASSATEAEVRMHHQKDLSLLKKELNDPDITLIDSRNKSEIQKVKASVAYSDEKSAEIVYSMESKYDRPMIPVQLGKDGKIKGGESRILLDKEGLETSLHNMKAFQREVEVPISETAPNVTEKNIKGIDQAVLASYKTTFNSSVAGRTTNIALSSKAINQVILGPGDRFYFNLFVGERSAAKGYQTAMEIVNKELVEGIGGGICQTSSTLYNAVDKAGLEIIELNHHSKAVGYVPLDRDATVSFGGKDFKFRNNKSYPVMIKTIMNKKAGTLEVQVTAAKKYVAHK
jgi:vancomycin resistance protein YoaR